KGRMPVLALGLLGATVAAFRLRSRVAYSGQKMVEEYVSFYKNLYLSDDAA
ncbi:hypothetical protein ACQWF3_25330, partial [Salmonella enterica subsp. enterica serovar Infantis]